MIEGPSSPIFNRNISPMSHTSNGILAGSRRTLISGGTFVDVKGNIQTCSCYEYKGTYNRQISILVLTARRMEIVVSEGQFPCPLQLEQPSVRPWELIQGTRRHCFQGTGMDRRHRRNRKYIMGARTVMCIPHCTNCRRSSSQTTECVLGHIFL